MGTNFYWKDPTRILGRPVETDAAYDPLVHIGKRSAAGPYCFDCGVTLVHNDVVAGFTRHHDARNKLVHTGQAGQSDTCPECGTGKTDETIEMSAAGLELGFREGPPTPEERQGVKSCSSFGWAQDPGWVLSKLLELGDNEETVVIDEYEREYSAREFLKDVLVACPLWFTDSVGIAFS